MSSNTVLDVDWYFDHVAYSGTHTPTRAAIARTLARLPEPIAQWAASKCVFVSVGGEIAGHCLSLDTWARMPKEQPTHVIALAEPAMEGQHAEYVVAHELAHARLGHSAFAKPGEGTEEAADALGARWGFSRASRTGHEE